MDAAKADGVDPDLTIDEDSDGSVPGGVVAHIALSDPDDELTKDNVEPSDPRFEVIEAYGELWLKLKAGEKLDHETEGTIDITLTVTDAGGLTDTAEVTITVTDVNEPPTASGAALAIDGEAGEPLGDDAMIDLLAAFSDPDGDVPVRYAMSGGPPWLTFSVQFGKDDDENPTAKGLFTGTPPAGTDTSHTVTITATDAGGLEASTSVRIVVDDGNDEITGIDLIDGEGNATNLAEVKENDDSGPVLGEIRVKDPDDPRHLNGMHKIEILKAEEDPTDPNAKKDDRFEVKPDDAGVWTLVVKEGSTFDKEDKDNVEITIRAVDRNGETNSKGDKFTGSIGHQAITVFVNDQNDGPTVLNKPGNWWVTVDADLEAEPVEKGQWLTFLLETQGASPAQDDLKPLFADADRGDALKYSIVRGPEWLEIDGDIFQNKAGTLPTRGFHDVTVRATDPDGEFAEASFRIAVVLEDPDGGSPSNDDPKITSREVDISETAKVGDKVASITIEDDDLDVAGIHPWGNLTVVVEATATISGSPTDLQTWTNVSAPDRNPNDNFLNLVEVSRDSDSVTYDIVLGLAAVSAMNPNRINAERYEKIDITVTAYDGTVTVTGQTSFNAITGNTDGADIDSFSIDIDNVNEGPELTNIGDHSSPLTAATATSPVSYGTNNTNHIEQQHDGDSSEDGNQPQLIYLNLSKLFTDPEGDDIDSFSASLNNVPWLSLASRWNEDERRMTSGPVQWEHIEGGPDENVESVGDNVVWAPGTKPDDDDWVLILEADRTGMDAVGGNRPDASEIGQDDNGLITIVATDEDGASSTVRIAVNITDENLDPRADGSMAEGVRVSDTTPFEKQTVTFTFDPTVDPDFTGPNAKSPVVVITEVVNNGSTPNDASVDAGVGGSHSYTVAQTDVGDTLQGRAVYYEVFQGSIVRSNPGDDSGVADALTTAATEPVVGRNDAATGTITFSTDASDRLVASVSVKDADGTTANDEATYTWESSDNGRGGWERFDADGTVGGTDAPDTAMATIPDNIEGKHVRLVYTFKDAGGGSERIASEAIKIGDIDTVAGGNLPTINYGTAGDIPVGRTLRIDLSKAAPTGGSATAEWLFGGKKAGEGASYTVTDADRGAISVRVTSRDKDGNVTSIVTVGGGDDGRSVVSVANTPPVPSGLVTTIEGTDTFTIDLGAAPADDGKANDNTLVSLETTVDMASLFEDAEGDPLTFAFTSPGNFVEQTIGGSDLEVYLDDNPGDGEGDQLLIVEPATGKVRYYTTQSQNHDGTDTDGIGNFVTTTLTATARTGDMTQETVDVRFRIDVEPTGFQVDAAADSDPTTDADSPTSTVPHYQVGTGLSVVEEVTVLRGSTPGTQDADTAQVVARIDVQDQNMDSHEYGKYKFAVDDDRFEAVPVPNSMDGSQAIVRLKMGQKIDREAEKDVNMEADGTQIYLIVTATPESGNFDPISLRLTVTIENSETEIDPPGPTAAQRANMVPGLKDNEAGDDLEDDTADTDVDNDDDGGTPVPMDAMATFASALDGGLF